MAMYMNTCRNVYRTYKTYYYALLNVIHIFTYMIQYDTPPELEKCSRVLTLVL